MLNKKACRACSAAPALDPDGTLRCDRYYDACDGPKVYWKQGERPVRYLYQRNFYAETCGHVYTRNLPEALRGTPWEYCPLHSFYEHFREPMELYPFLAAHLEHPKLEHLVYRSSRSCALDETQNRTRRLLGVAAEDVPLPCIMTTLRKQKDILRRQP